MSLGMADAAAPAESGRGGGGSDKRTPSEFLKNVLGRPVVVKLNSGVDYRGEAWHIPAAVSSQDGGASSIALQLPVLHRVCVCVCRDRAL